MKIIYVPYDYSCFTFYPPDFLTNSYNNNATIAQSIYICGYGLPSANSKVLRLTFTRVFEGIPTSYYEDYFSTESSKYNFDECNELTQKIINQDLLISSLEHENKIIKLLNEN